MRLIDEHALVIAGKGTVIDGELYIKVDDLNKCLDKAEVVQPQGIDKDRLIEEMDKLKLNKLMDIRSYSVMSHTLDLVKDIINQQHTSDGWIPVSERLPDKEDLSDDGFVLVQEGQGAMFKGRYDTDVSTWYDDVGLTFCNGVIAWQPLPQPYKESE